ncbi:MAG: hypothetical protein ACKVVO_10425 [Opitutaceae bacterium]
MAAAAFTPPAFSQNFWAPLNGPTGGPLSSIAIDPGNGRLFAGAAYSGGYNLGAGALFRSTDGASSWTRLGDSLAAIPEGDSVARSVAVSPGGDVYVAFSNAGVYRSTDGGDHWSPVSSGLPNLQIRKVAVAPTGEVYCCPTNAGVHQLNSATLQWSAVNPGLTNLNGQCFAFGPGIVLLGTRGGGVFKRIGSGPWTPVNSGLGNLQLDDFAGAASSTLYAATDAGLYSSSDGAETWTSLGGPFAGSLVHSCGLSAGTVVVGTSLGIYRAANGGAWTAGGAGFPGKFVRGFVTDAGGRLYAATDLGVYRSADAGVNFAPVNSGLIAQTVSRVIQTTDGALLAGTFSSGLYRSRDGGATWDVPALPSRFVFALAESPWGDLFAGNYTIDSNQQSDGHAWRSQDQGASWTSLDNGLRSAMVSGFVFPGAQQVMCSAAFSPGGVYESNVNGNLWTRLGPPQSIPAYFLGRSPSGDLYIGSEGIGVWRLPAGRTVWENKGFTQSQQFTVAFNSLGHIFFGNDGRIRGVYRSTDGGQTFQPLNSYPSLFAWTIVILPDGTIFAGGKDAGVQRSTTNGDTWENTNSGMPTNACTWLTLGRDRHLYAGSIGRGVFRSALPVVAASVPGAQEPRLANLSTRAQTAPGAAVLTAGFAIGAGARQQVLVRAVGPTLGLAPFNIAGVLPDPFLTLFNSSSSVVATNDNWGAPIDTAAVTAATFNSVGAFALPAGSRDAALLTTLAPGNYTAQVTGTAGSDGTGLAIVEIYEMGGNGAKLINLSARGQVLAGSNLMIPGIVIAPGTGTRRLLVRAAGPALAAFQLSGALADPTITLTNSTGAITFATNNDWGTPSGTGAASAATLTAAFNQAGAFTFANGSKDSALLVDLAPGNYTLQVTGVSGATGLAIVEIYDLTPVAGETPVANGIRAIPIHEPRH